MNKEIKKRMKNIRRQLYSLKLDGELENQNDFLWGSSIDIYNVDKLVGFLYPLGYPNVWSSHNNILVPLLAKWRSENIYAFKNQDKISIEKTRKWMIENVFKNKDKILFMIYDLYNKPLGHIGLAEFNYEENSCEIDNVIRGEKDIPGMMTFALTAIIKWAKEVLNIKEINLRVLIGNEHAFKFYEKNGFKYYGEDEEFIKIKLQGG